MLFRSDSVDQNDSSEKVSDPEKIVGAPEIIDVNDLSLKDHASLIGILKEIINEHGLDPNFPTDILSRARGFVDSDSESINSEQLHGLLREIESEKQLLLNDSPYAEVRAVVPATDDPSMPANTFRVWFLGTIFTIIGTGVNQFFSLRLPLIYFYSNVAQLVSYPCGRAMDRWLPTKKFNIFGRQVSLNPGPFNQKEHMLITIMSNVAWGGNNGTAYVTSIFQVLKLERFYNEKNLANNAGFQILLVLSTQLIGYGCAGLTRRFLVYPPAMIWPKNLATIALNRALHNDNGNIEVHGWKITRQR